MSVSPQTEEQPRTTRQGFSLKRVKIRNYKSIASCDVEVKPFTLLVGRNGSGKSNFLDAIRFVGDALRSNVMQAAFRDRIPLLFHQTSAGVATSFEIELQVELPSGSSANFVFTFGSTHGRLGMEREFAKIMGWGGNTIAEYRVGMGETKSLLIHGQPIHPAPPDYFGGFYLAQVAAFPEFRELYNALISMDVYRIDPDRVRKSLVFGSLNVLDSDGGNVADVLKSIESNDEAAQSRITSYLGAIVPEIRDVHTRDFGGQFRAIAFYQVNRETDQTSEFTSKSMSDGTLRALGILVAINQLANDGSPIRLVGIEEPETALHPAASGALMDALREASVHTQVLVTTHSPDLLDLYDPEEDHLLVVKTHEGQTQIGEMDGASRNIIRKHLMTAGDLLRIDQLEPDRGRLDLAVGSR